ncbi:MAG: Cna B-type domain-containing protein, partial [Bacteroidales bacterium]|nr:Cna B-type domain-containing protein [Bacteroidales bacterium]
GLPKYANGDEITYTITEDPVEGYDSSVIQKEDGTWEVINTLIPETETPPDSDNPPKSDNPPANDNPGTITGTTGGTSSTGSTSSPGSTSGKSAAKTDDTGNAGLWLILVVIAAAAAVGSVTVRMRKTKQSRR